jgi:hypothetical protein
MRSSFYPPNPLSRPSLAWVAPRRLANFLLPPPNLSELRIRHLISIAPFLTRFFTPVAHCFFIVKIIHASVPAIDQNSPNSPNLTCSCTQFFINTNNPHSRLSRSLFNVPLIVAAEHMPLRNETLHS